MSVSYTYLVWIDVDDHATRHFEHPILWRGFRSGYFSIETYIKPKLNIS